MSNVQCPMMKEGVNGYSYQKSAVISVFICVHSWLIVLISIAAV